MTNATQTDFELAAGLVCHLFPEGRWGEALERLTKARAGIDELIPVLVRNLRRDGATWNEVGDILGISTQAAHKRFASGGDEPLCADPVLAGQRG